MKVQCYATAVLTHVLAYVFVHVCGVLASGYVTRVVFTIHLLDARLSGHTAGTPVQFSSVQFNVSCLLLL